MINRDDIEAGDKCYTRDGGCLVARLSETGNGNIILGENFFTKRWESNGRYLLSSDHPLDIIRIEKAPKPVVKVLWIFWDNNAGEYRLDEEKRMNVYVHAIKLTIINGKMDKWEQVK